MSLFKRTINCYNQANWKKHIGEYIVSRKHNHKAFLRKYHLGKFAKSK